MYRSTPRASSWTGLAALASAILVLPFAASGQTLQPAPSWVRDIAPGTWSAVSQNRIADVDPANDPAANPRYPNSPPWSGSSGQKAVITAWNGGSFASGLGNRGSYLIYGGGHADYYGSEVYAFDMETRRWSRLTNPYVGPFNWPYSTAGYPDGSAIPPHTYDFVDYHPRTNSFVLLKGQTELGPPSNQTAVATAHALDLTTKRWRRSQQNGTVDINSGGYSVYDSKRDVFWVEGGSGSSHFAKFDPNTTNSDGTFGTWTNYALKYSGTDSVAAYDPIRDIFVVTGFRSGTDVYAIDLNNPTASRVTLNQSGAPPARDSAHGWEWSHSRQAFLYFRDGDGVYEMRLSGGDWRTSSWNWREITSSNNSVTPQAPPSTGLYSRFRVARYSDAEVAVVVNDVGGSVYAFRIPPAIGPNPPTAVTAN